jgi:hypothetical protein
VAAQTGVTAHTRLHTTNSSFCTHAATHRKRELLHTCGYTQQTGVTAHMWLHTAKKSYCEHAGYTQQQELLHTWGYTYQTEVIAHMRLHTARLWHLTSTVLIALAKSRRTALPEITETLQSVHHQRSGSISTLCLYTTDVIIYNYTMHRNVVDIHSTELLGKYAAPNCCGVILWTMQRDISVQ